MHNGDWDGSPERSGLVSCGQWMMPVLWSGGRAGKISNKQAGDVTCLGGSVVEHQPRLLGSRVWFPAGAFAISSVSPKALHPIPFFLSLSLSPPLPFSLPSTFRFRLKTYSSHLSLDNYIWGQLIFLRFFSHCHSGCLWFSLSFSLFPALSPFYIYFLSVRGRPAHV